jgi:hypothetical protein
MAKGKTRKGQTIYIVCPLSFSFGHYFVCPFVIFLGQLYFLSFCRFSFDHYIVCPFVIFGQRKKEKTTNSIMAKGKRQKDKQYNGQRKMTKRQTI